MGLAIVILSGALQGCGILTAKYLSNVHRWLLDSTRCTVVWVFGLSLHYLWDRESTVGEPWTRRSYLQVVGFVVLIVGQLVFNDLVTLPCFQYGLLTHSECFDSDCTPAVQT